MESINIAGLSNPETIQNVLIPWAIQIGVAIAIFIIGRWVAKWLTGIVEKLMNKSNLDVMLVNFIGNLVYTVLLLVVVMAALDHLGIETTSLLAVFGAAGLAIGLALKDSLANFSSGVMIILFRPFKVGDFVEAGGATGVIEEVQMFATIMRTGDNREIIVPNGQIYSGTITNYSARPTRRIDLVFGIGYDDDIAKAKQIINDIMKQDERILSDPEPAVAMAELADSSVNFNVRPWVKSGDYWPVHADLLEKVKLAFDANGISIPYPQQEVHMHNVD
ncbi:small conductance mechanosensitive channel [Thiogranum longum]|uniref:Small-conductance mechanosensitive channel n=1 Tax=Thiogranum longum TaxID=1537524 RepID=A0A4R1HCY5_9GAMM|nr:mechanosensitive ion channel domain-containing protein [Thiogranum longum]TCK18080.1 small conductance mechanosensitive channel [Thiogranum longum]